ncbi:A24 family peptidase [Phenylobacterium sp.]|jgi:leader peptidase (prepilin peptidase)/N-methyltransferase|uniref:prepilin peptidase n=1 Tax=Phenylobacterium sp. TaxID=1871053 RepID=UPI002E3673A7|nr:A24 family peptidase [Phenylobacterium sp.]HEX3365611.1 A24 family peptidase [Phenylobacterium sp.]
MMAEAPILGVAALAGLALGSYAVTAALRFGRAEGASSGRSHCDSCGQTLGFAQTVPLVSYAVARGACASCRAKIDPAHLVGELGGALILTIAFADGVTLRAALLSALGLILLAVSVIDWKIGRLPNAFTGPLAVAALALAALRSVAAVESGLLAAAATFVVFQGVRWLSLRRRGDPGLGLGDVKLMCALAIWLNLATPWMVVGATALAGAGIAIRRSGQKRIPFGPALAGAGWIVGMAGEWGHWPTTA